MNVKMARRLAILLVCAASMMSVAVPAMGSPAKGNTVTSAVTCDVSPGLPYRTGTSVAVDGSVRCHDEANQPVVVDEILGQVALIRDANLMNAENFDVFWVSGHTKTISAPCVNGVWEGAINLYIWYQGRLITSGVWEGSWFGLTTSVTC